MLGPFTKKMLIESMVQNQLHCQKMEVAKGKGVNMYLDARDSNKAATVSGDIL